MKHSAIASLSSLRPLRAAAPTARQRQRRAFTLIEVIISVGILSIAILTLIALFGTVFRQIEDVVNANRAVNVVKTVENAFATPEIIGGTKIPKIDDKATAKFDALYGFLRIAVDGRKVPIYYFERVVKNNVNQSETIIPILYNTNGGPFTRDQYKKLEGIGTVFRVDIQISPQLKKQRIELDDSNKDDPLPSKSIYDGGALPSDAAKFALAELPVYIEIFPHNFGTVSDEAAAVVRPILAQTLIINR
ncbi:MAG: type II secretion system GspH family protein [Puniceicoccales bacterium]|jgi:prepilin-type N-terminal cleavage/methylation domain-containing protein|nr:type II secretion system GspH family protein [Puniceicoccales bacterium]